MEELTDAMFKMRRRIELQQRMLRQTEDAMSRLLLKAQMDKYGASASLDKEITILFVYVYDGINLKVRSCLGDCLHDCSDRFSSHHNDFVKVCHEDEV
jgi:hypothetical protein